MRRIAIPTLTALTLLLGAAACGSADETAAPAATSAPSADATGRMSAPATSPSPSGSPSPTGSWETGPDLDRPGVLAALQRRGGMCPDGPCGTSLVVTADGTWVRTGAGSEDGDSGELTDAQLATIEDAVAATTLGDAEKFDGTCPVAYDGQEVVLSWRVGDELRTAASCTVQFPDDDPLLRVMSTTLGDLADDAD